MAAQILDIDIEQGYRFNFNIDLNDLEDNNLEEGYTCHFESPNIGKLDYTIEDGQFKLTLGENDTNKAKHLDNYTVYVKNISTGFYDKLLYGRIHLDKRVRSI